WAVRPLKRYASWVQNVARQWTSLSINLAICWELRVSRATRRSRGSDNAPGADNQQERLVSCSQLSRILRDCTPDRARSGPEDTVRAAWRHAESGRNDLALGVSFPEVTTLSVPIRHGRWELERSRL